MSPTEATTARTREALSADGNGQAIRREAPGLPVSASAVAAVSAPVAEAGTPWYKTAVIYQLHVRAFFDSNDDGIGDFAGLTEKLDYLQELGVTALWVLPFYPSPLRDDGYDIANYGDVHPSYGTLKDFKTFLREAHRRGLKVITELVLNHTSDQHPWFQRARSAKPGTWQRDFYVWSDTADKYTDARIIFKDFELSNWTWDHVAQAYYWHRFYSHQPDLNFDNPKVQQALLQSVDYWLKMGVDGLRLDAVPYLYEREGTNCENLPETHDFLKRLRAHIDTQFSERMLLAEANQWPEDAVAYFGDGDECHAAFHFPVMPRLYMAVQMEDRFPIVDILQQTPSIPPQCQWFTFLRNHDELTLEMVTDEERDYMYRTYAHDRQARINFGIRRRLAPLLGNNRRKIELLNGLLFSLPGTPVIYYGDEIGMGDNIYLGDRNGVRTPMQWSSDRNAGFSRANPQRLYLPLVVDPEYIYEALNVETQRNNPQSFWWWMKRLIALRHKYPAFGRGELEILTPDNLKVLAFLRRDVESSVLVVANLSRFSQFVELDLSAFEGHRPIELFGQTKFPPIGRLPYMLTLGPHAFYWFVLRPPHQEAAAPGAGGRGGATLHVRESWEEVFRAPHRAQLEQQFARWLVSRRWFSAKARDIQHVRLLDTVPVGKNLKQPRHMLLLLRVEYTQGEGEGYAIPMAFAVEDEARAISEHAPDSVLLRVHIRQSKQDGILFDAMQDKAFPRDMLDMILHRRQAKGGTGEVAPLTTKAAQLLRGVPADQLMPASFGADQSNSSIVFGERAVMKLFRRLEAGINPELEIGRFLTERSCFLNTPPLLGALEYDRGPTEERITLGVVHQFIPNANLAWKHALDHIGRYFEQALTEPVRQQELASLIPSSSLVALAAAELPSAVQEYIGGYQQAAELLGQRTAEMHRALVDCPEDPAFAPEPFSQLYQRSVYQSVRKQILQTMELLRRQRSQLPESSRPMADEVLSRQKELLENVKAITARKVPAMRIRCHGDYHLGQVLYTGKDFIILDFEGEPTRSLAERRLKRSPLYDVAGMIRSFHYCSRVGQANVVKRGMSSPEDSPALGRAAQLWYTATAATFLQAYLKESSHSNLLPTAAEELERLLQLYLLEKACYELRYELNNRPDWVEVPMQGIIDIAGVKT
jgi:maltose alpha-D-glucosyltransferase/alpha-amylase